MLKPNKKKKWNEIRLNQLFSNFIHQFFLKQRFYHLRLNSVHIHFKQVQVVNALTTLIKLSLKCKRVNEHRRRRQKKKLGSHSAGKNMSFDRSDHTCKNARVWYLIFTQLFFLKRFFLSFFLCVVNSHEYWNVMAIGVTFLRSCVIALFLRKLAVVWGGVLWVLQWQMRWRFYEVAV